MVKYHKLIDSIINNEKGQKGKKKKDKREN